LAEERGEDGLDLSAGIQINEAAGLVPELVDITASNGVIHTIDRRGHHPRIPQQRC